MNQRFEPPSTPAGELIEQLLDRWEELRECGRVLSVDELLKHEQIVLEEPQRAVLAAKLQALQSVEHWMYGQQAARSSYGTNGDARGDEAPGRARLLRFHHGDELQPGYRLVAPLGAGGFGEIWKALGPGGFPVAIKFVRLAQEANESERRALDLLKRLRHPHLVITFGAWIDDGLLTIAMELADRTLMDRFREVRAQGHNGIPFPELLHYMEQAAKALDFLAQPQTAPEGVRPAIQHRDIKPQNLLLVGDIVKVADFGLACALRSGAAGHTGRMSTAYAAPEFFTHATSDKSDQYSLAVTYCYLRGGRLPFEGSDLQMMRGHLDEPPDLTMLPESERPAVARALAKVPAERWPTCGEFVAALRSAGDAAETTDGLKRATKLGQAAAVGIGAAPSGDFPRETAVNVVAPSARSARRLIGFGAAMAVSLAAVVVTLAAAWPLRGSGSHVNPTSNNREVGQKAPDNTVADVAQSAAPSPPANSSNPLPPWSIAIAAVQSVGQGEDLTIPLQTDPPEKLAELDFEITHAAADGASIDQQKRQFVWRQPADVRPGVYGFTIRGRDKSSPPRIDTRPFKVAVRHPRVDSGLPLAHYAFDGNILANSGAAGDSWPLVPRGNVQALATGVSQSANIPAPPHGLHGVYFANGATQEALIGHKTMLYGRQWSICLWFYRQQAADDDWLIYQGERVGYGGGNPEFSVFLTGPDKLRLMNFATFRQSDKDMDLTVPDIAPQTWHHLVITFDGRDPAATSPGMVKVYVNGEERSRAGNVDLSITLVNSLSNLCFGAVHVPNDASRRRVLHGALADLRIYDRELTPAEVAALYGGKLPGS